MSESPTLGHYVRFNFKAALITDEKREQLLSVLMDAVWPGTAAEIEAQLQDEIEALRREYEVAGKRVNFYYVLHDAPRSERRLLLRGQWKDDAALSRARTAFIKTYTSRRSR